MTMQAVSIKIPDTIAEYAVVEDEKDMLIRNAMILFPYIKNDTISHGKAAELLGIHKMDLIALYGSLGIPYFDQPKEEGVGLFCDAGKVGAELTAGFQIGIGDRAMFPEIAQPALAPDANGALFFRW